MDVGGHGGSWATGGRRAGYQPKRPDLRRRAASLLFFTRRKAGLHGWPRRSGDGGGSGGGGVRSRDGGRARAAAGGFLRGTAALLASALLAVALGPAGAGDDPLRILMLGDSLTAGYGLASRDALPARLETVLRAHRIDARVINAGVSGDTTSGGLARLDWALVDDPHAVIVALGANDGLRAIDPAVTRTNLDRLLGILAERDLPVLLAGMVAPPNLGAVYAARFDPIYPELAARHGAILYPFLLDGVATVTLLNQEDGIHPNAAGVEVIARRMLPAVLCLAGRAGNPPDPAMADAAGLAAGGAGFDCDGNAPSAGASGPRARVRAGAE